MNYYIRGNKEKADQIKAAFEKLGYTTAGFNFKSDKGVYYTDRFCKSVDFVSAQAIVELIKTHPGYKELELPKPHYDISNFKPFDRVLVRDADDGKWRCNWFSHYIGDGGVYRFVTTKCGYAQCIPFEGNEHLLGTTDMPSEEYINW